MLPGPVFRHMDEGLVPEDLIEQEALQDAVHEKAEALDPRSEPLAPAWGGQGVEQPVLDMQAFIEIFDKSEDAKVPQL